ncbi:MAG: membrane protein insertion efficiency factor YidD [Kineosporiaceae bacterium]|jgi:uncharacterized protein
MTLPRWVAASPRFAIRVPAYLLIGIFRLWQLLASPTYGQTCRFYPTCSSYGVEAVRVHGALRGGWMSVRRIGRCHPWNPGGVDLVPPARGQESGHASGHEHGHGAHPHSPTTADSDARRGRAA